MKYIYYAWRPTVTLVAICYLLSVGAFAQDRWVGKVVTLSNYCGFCYDLSDAALYAAVTEDASHLLDFIVTPGTQIKILESSYHGLAPDDKFYRAKILSGDEKGELGWFDGYRLNSSRSSSAPPAVRQPSVEPASTYPKAGQYWSPW